MYLRRSLEPVLRRAAAEFPAVLLTGPRQSGKTTLLRHCFGRQAGYVSLELPDIRMAANDDPRGFLDHHEPPVIFDEVQYAPALLPYIKERIDQDRHLPGQFLLTGSQNLLLNESISESLAGRAAILRLLPLSRFEAQGRPDARFPWEETPKKPPKPVSGPDLWREFLRGGYPELVATPDRDVALWHSSYVQTYLERDVRTLRNVGDLTQFRAFLQALAARTGQLINFSDLARDLGVAVNTVRSWISVLEATWQIVILRPYFRNVGKRLVKTPKVYFTDVGTLCHLAGLRDVEHARAGPMGGAIVETAVLSEIVRVLAHRGQDPRVFFWRTSAGVEVDFLVEGPTGLVAIEVKLSSTPSSGMASSIRTLREDLGDALQSGWLVHPGDVQVPLGSGITAIPLSSL